MLARPSLLICDEPTTALDVTVQKTILELIKELQQLENMGVIFITHDLEVVGEIADRVAIMYKGEIVEHDTNRNIFNAPKHAYTKALIACRPAHHSKEERLPTVADFLQKDGSGQEPGAASTKIVPTPAASTDSVLVKVENLSVQFPGKSSLLGRPGRILPLSTM